MYFFCKTYLYFVDNEKKIIEYCKENGIEPIEIKNAKGFEPKTLMEGFKNVWQMLDSISDNASAMSMDITIINSSYSVHSTR